MLLNNNSIYSLLEVAFSAKLSYYQSNPEVGFGKSAIGVLKEILDNCDISYTYEEMVNFVDGYNIIISIIPDIENFELE